jgi:hypothetical protein
VPLRLSWLLKSLKKKIPRYWSNPPEVILAGRRTICFDIHKPITSIWNKEELPQEWKELIIVPIYKKADTTDCSNYRGLLLLSTTYKILSNNLLSVLTPYAKEIIGDHQCGFWCTRSTTDHIFCIQPILQKKCREAVHQLFIDFQKTYDSNRREVSYNILIEFGIPMTLVKLLKVCLNETYSKVQAHKHLPQNFPTKNGLKEEML